MHRFFTDENGFAITAEGIHACLDPGDAQHARRVLRLPLGTEVALTDGCTSRLARIEIMSEAGVRCRVLDSLPSAEAALRLTLFQGLPKADKMDWIVQKLTELGAAEIVPVAMARCVARMDAREAEKKRERWQRIAREAAKQSGRTAPSAVGAVLALDDVLHRLPDFNAALVPWENAEGFGPLEARREFPKAARMALVVGPEGGITAEEVQSMEAAGARRMTLGPRILRTETAGMAAAAALLALYGDMA